MRGCDEGLTGPGFRKGPGSGASRPHTVRPQTQGSPILPVAPGWPAPALSWELLRCPQGSQRLCSAFSLLRQRPALQAQPASPAWAQGPLPRDPSRRPGVWDGTASVRTTRVSGGGAGLLVRLRGGVHPLLEQVRARPTSGGTPCQEVTSTCCTEAQRGEAFCLRSHSKQGPSPEMAPPLASTHPELGGPWSVSSLAGGRSRQAGSRGQGG